MINELAKQRPILFSSPMVQAILEGRKIMTRRILKPQPHESITDITFGFSALTPDGCIECRGHFIVDEEKRYGSKFIKCPYGKIGEILWVRETVYAYGYWDLRWSDKKERNEWFFVDQTLEKGLEYKYFNNPPEIINSKKVKLSCRWYKRPSIFMPKTACRIFLEITNVRVERLQDISQEDAKLEGVYPAPHRCTGWANSLNQYQDCFKCAFKSLWQKINDPKSWEANPFVWVVEFKKIEKPL